MEKQERLYTLNECLNRCYGSGICRTQKEFAEKVGVNASVLSAALKGKDEYLTDKLVSRVIAAVDKLELEHTFPSIDNTKPQDYVTTLPVIPVEAMAGTLGEFSRSVALYDCEKIVSPIKGADYAIRVSGESMSPEYPNGSQVLIKKVNENAFIEWGKVYVLDTDNGAVIKVVRKTNDSHVIECVPLNPDFQPFEIDTKYIHGWYRVLMVLATK